MKKRLLGLHGTHETAFNRILKEGFRGADGSNVWSCSGGWNYFWDPTRFESWGDEEQPFREAFDDALGSAYIAMPFAAAGEYHRVVMLVDLTGLVVEDDVSCANMDNAVRVAANVPSTRILCAWRDPIDLAPFRLQIIAENIDRPMYQKPDLSPVEEAFLDANADALRELSVSSLLMEHESIELTYTRPNLPKWANAYARFPSEPVVAQAAA